MSEDPALMPTAESIGSTDPTDPTESTESTGSSGSPAVTGSPDGQDPDIPTPPTTGDPSVDAALSGLRESAISAGLDEQIEAGEGVHRALQDRLADLGGG